jgi:hypothetical protein
VNDAVKYFKKNGLQRSKELIEMGFGFCSLEDGLSFHTEQLKQLVESHELVGSYGGLSQSRKWIERTVFKLSDSMIALKKAIADVESCMGVASGSN